MHGIPGIQTGPLDVAAARLLGLRLRAELAGWPVPMLAVETTFSLLRGTAAPRLWGAALGALAGDAPDGALALIADRDDLLGLPAALESWPAGGVGIGASLGLPPLQDALASTPIQEVEILLGAPGARGYAALCRLLSRHHEEPMAYREWLTHTRERPDDLAGLVALVADPAWALRLAALGLEVFWRSGTRPRLPPPEVTAAGIEAIAVPRLSHLDASGLDAAPILRAIRDGTTIAGGAAARAAPAGDVLVDLGSMPSAYAGREDWCERGRALLRRFRHDPRRDAAGKPVLHLPPSPHHLVRDANEELRALTEAGLTARYGEHPGPAVRDRLEHELRVIAEKDFAGYILTVHDLANGRRTCGRGSGASSIVCYLLALTNVDPVRYNLLFERFLAPERIDPPDIDIDFPWDERDAVLQEAIARYGTDRAALVGTHQKLSRWAALREAARAHGFDDAAITAARDQYLQAQRYGHPTDLPDPWPAIRHAATVIAGAPRHLGVHCGGVVITSTPLRSLVPVHPAAKTIAGEHVPCIAWEKDGAEALGLVKIDLLGNRSLAVIRDCLQDLAQDGIVINEHRWCPETDPNTQRIVAAGATMGCFYIESPAMRQLQAKVGSGDFDRLVVHSSIIRPAANRWIAEYINRHHHVLEHGTHLEAWYPHPALQGLLSESYGILSYQEDVMLVCQRLAGFGSREANTIRKALGKSDAAERLRELASDFFAGCERLGVATAVADTVWDMVCSFAGYSFCKAHSASFAMVSFQCAYLKAHHPAHFLARVIANEGGFYPVSAYLEEARRHGIAIAGPCVVKSHWLTQREGAGCLRIGFHRVPGLGRSAADRILEERRRAPFASLADLRRRCALSADDLAHLHKAAAFDALLAPLTSSQRAWTVAAVAQKASPARQQPGQQSLHDHLDLESAGDPKPPHLPELAEREHHRHLYSHLGFLAHAHPLTLWDLPRGRMRCKDVGPHLKGRRIHITAMSITRKDVTALVAQDKAGHPLSDPQEEPMSFATFEDETGLLETVWFPETYRAFGSCLDSIAPVVLTGKVEVDHGVPTLTVASAKLYG